MTTFEEEIKVVVFEVVMLMFGNETRGLKRTRRITNIPEKGFNWKL